MVDAVSKVIVLLSVFPIIFTVVTMVLLLDLALVIARNFKYIKKHLNINFLKDNKYVRLIFII